MSPALDYLQFSLWLTAQQLLLVLAPLLIMAYLMHLSNAIVKTLLREIFSAKIYVYFTFLGVICHELGHAVFCILFGHKLKKVKLIQVRENAPLGYVTHSYKKGNIFASLGNFFIGTGPIWFGAVVILILIKTLLPSSAYSLISNFSISNESVTSTQALMNYSNAIVSLIKRFVLLFDKDSFQSIQFWLWIYLSFSIGSHISLSKADISNAGKGFIILLFCLVLINLITSYWVGGDSLELSRMLANYVVFIVLTLALVMVLNCLLSAFLFVFYLLKKML